MHRSNIRDNHAFAIYSSSNDSLAVIDATNNWWGLTDSLLIENIVYHRADRAESPLVKFVPFADAPFTIDPGTAVDDDPDTPSEGIPAQFALGQNYPNPFNAGTVIEFSLPARGEVTIAIYDILGRLTRELLHQSYLPGTHAVLFDGKDIKGHPLPSGVYFYRLLSRNFSESRKMLLIK